MTNNEVFVRAARPRAALSENADPLAYARYEIIDGGFCVGSGPSPASAWRNARVHVEGWLLFEQRRKQLYPS